MPGIALKKVNKNEISIAKKMKDYSNEPVFRKKAEKAIRFLKKHGLPKSFARKKK